MKNCSSYLNNSGKIETLSIFSLIVPVIYVILNVGNSPTQILQADLLLAGLRMEGRKVTFQKRCKCHLSCFYYYFQRKKILVWKVMNALLNLLFSIIEKKTRNIFINITKFI